MAERYSIRVTKDHLVFSAGHFITFDGRHCERLHGHNYRGAVVFESPLDPNQYVFDFIALRDRMQELVNDLDHRMLVAVKNPQLKTSANESSVRIQFEAKEWVFPREDCILLDIENTTAERLAKYLAERLLDMLNTRHRFSPGSMRLEVEESFGQSATYEWRG